MAKEKNDPNPSLNILSEEILSVFHRFPNKTFNYKQVSKALSIQEHDDKNVISDILLHLTTAGSLMEVEKGKYKLKPTNIYAEGIIDISASGAAYVMNDDFEDDIYIAPKNVKHALNGDKVKIYLYAKRRDRRLEGEVLEVIERAKNEFVGTIQESPKFAFLVPDSHKMLVDIFIPIQNLNDAQDGQKAIAEITEWPKGTKNPVGRIKKVLGWPGENNTEMHAILAEYGFPTEFPPEVEHEAEQIPDVISQEEIKKRKDFRKITTFTIDPVDAKDFDDALSIRKLDNGDWEIGVHIADVSHYIRPGSLLDEEGAERATSIYLVDRVVPMLPEKLSNGVCSLRPNEDKLCFSAVFVMDDEAKIKSEWFGRTVIHSDKRFSYEEAQKVLEDSEGPYLSELQTLDRLAKKMRAERFKAGAISFEKAEVKFHLDEKGNPTGVYTKEIKDTNQLIEDFMLLANKKVAELIGKPKTSEKPKTFVYRIHDVPNAERLTAFSHFAGQFGYKINTQTDKDIAFSLNKLLKDVRGKGEQNVIEQLAVRTMAKAVYTTDNIGHYGLGFDYYTHFTSPIRRYPDVMVHRLLQHYLDGGKSENQEHYEELCKHSTDMEIRAAEAERASIKYKQVQYLQDKVGQEFEGIISGVTEWGIYIEIIENKCEGMIRLRELNDDFYEFDESNFCIIGSRTGNRYQLGDKVKVKVKRADLHKKQIDFMMATESTNSGFSIEEEFAFNRPQPSKPFQNKEHSGGGHHSKGGGGKKHHHGKKDGHKKSDAGAGAKDSHGKKDSGPRKRRR